MKAITLRDPWAQLVARGLKKVETRGPTFPAKYRGPLAIHASKALTRDEALKACEFYETLGAVPPPGSPLCWPRGCVVAVCELIDVVRIEVIRGGFGRWSGLPRPAREGSESEDIVTIGGEPLPDAERPWGFWATGRKALILENVRRIGPFPAKGMLGLWEWTPPEVCGYRIGPGEPLLSPGIIQDAGGNPRPRP